MVDLACDSFGLSLKRLLHFCAAVFFIEIFSILLKARLMAGSSVR